MCDRALYLNDTIVSRAEYGMEYGPSIQYLKDIGFGRFYEHVSTIMLPGPTGRYQESDKLQYNGPADYRVATDKRYKDISRVVWISKNPVHPTYTKITRSNTITVDGIKHTAVIQDYCVLLDSVVIARAPDKKTKSARDTFCKAVIWSLMDEPDMIREFMQKQITTLSRFNLPADEVIAGGVPA